MTSVLQRHRIMIITLGLIIFLLLVYFFLFRQSTNKIPSRGVFVLHILQTQVNVSYIEYGEHLTLQEFGI